MNKILNLRKQSRKISIILPSQPRPTGNQNRDLSLDLIDDLDVFNLERQLSRKVLTK